MNDFALLREYALKGSEPAFETLVRRHLDMVYSVAFRQTGDAGVAEEVSQAAFILLARKAPSLAESVVVPGWLYRTACFMARRAMENRTRRRAVEKEAAEMSLNDSNDEVWSRMIPHIDAALSNLAEADRNALVLRFLQQRSFREVARELGISEDAAKKRVTRALEKVRSLLNRQGIAVALAAMSAALAANSVEAAPVSLVGSAVKAALGPWPRAGSATGFLVAEAAREVLVARIRKVTVLATAAFVMIAGFTWLRGLGLAGSEKPSRTVAGAAITPRAFQHLRVMASAKPAKTNYLILHVMAAESGAPLTQGVVFGVFSAPRIHSRSLDAQPDAMMSFPIVSSGAAQVALSTGRFNGAQLWATAPGRVPILMVWKREEEPSLPSEYTVRLDEATPIGGTVVDESGKPVVGASLNFSGLGIASTSWSRESVSYNTPATTPKTGSDGHWTADFVSAADVRANNEFVELTHPDFVGQNFRLQELRAAGTTNHLVMQRGCLVSGSLLDADGKPIHRATIDLAVAREAGANRSTDCIPGGSRFVVTLGVPPGAEPIHLFKRTDESGGFQFARIPPGSCRFSVRADGVVMTNFVFLASAGESNFPLTLSVPHESPEADSRSILRGRVIDDEWQPIQGITVELAPVQPGLEGPLEPWAALTDDQGRFEWKHAPARVVRLVVNGDHAQGVEGEEKKRDWDGQAVDTSPDGTETTIVLNSRTTMDLRLTVTDRETGQPVHSFKVAYGESSAPGDPGIAGLEFIGEGRDGRFVLRLPQGEPMSAPGPMGSHIYMVSMMVVRAAGYLDKIFPAPAQTNDLAVAVALERSPLITGRVLTPDGLAAAGAEVSLVKGFHFINASGGSGPKNQPGWTTVHADSDGVFRAKATSVPTLMAATHESGWSDLPLAASGENVIQLRPWSRLNGTVRLGGHDLAGAWVTVVNAPESPESPIQPRLQLGVRTDEAGRFEIPRMPDGRYQVYFTPRLWGGNNEGSHPRLLTLGPGESATVFIGGSGARVTGHAVLSSGVEPVDWRLSNGGLYYIGEADLAGYLFAFRGDGSFVIEDVPPGRYALQMHLSPSRIIRGKQPRWFEGTHQAVTIPESFAAGGKLDLGTIEIRLPAK